ncbi:MAG: tryptophan synthase subunit alpha [Verrucomicrobia bacterium]|nr:tryptophan synthase subunit alpha [Verrucomicrobiota bacterium]
MNRIDAKFAALRAAERKGFIAYICAGDPNLKMTISLAREFERVGVDVLELGIPFSDPLADGVVNQLAAERALRSGTTLAGVLDAVARLRRAGCRIPIVFYIYYNLIHRHGVGRFAREAAAAGVDGALALDLPPEEAAAYERAMKRAGLCPIYLIAPTTPEKRIAEICRHASGFIYYVSREGVTGMQKTVSGSIAPRMAVIRRHTSIPVAVGFGVSDPEQARNIAQHGDAVVVGSAIVNQIAKGRSARAVSRFVAPMVKAVNDARPRR